MRAILYTYATPPEALHMWRWLHHLRNTEKSHFCHFHHDSHVQVDIFYYHDFFITQSAVGLVNTNAPLYIHFYNTVQSRKSPCKVSAEIGCDENSLAAELLGRVSYFHIFCIFSAASSPLTLSGYEGYPVHIRNTT